MIRSTDFKGCDRNALRLWVLIVRNITPCFIEGYKSLDAQMSSPFADEVSIATEAFILWLIEVSYSKWKSEWESGSAGEAENGRNQRRASAGSQVDGAEEAAPTKKKTKGKKQGEKNYTQDNSDRYAELYDHVEKQRKDTTDWDLGVMKVLRREKEKLMRARMASGEEGSAPNKKAKLKKGKKNVIMPMGKWRGSGVEPKIGQQAEV